MMNSNFFNFTIRRLLLVRAERWWVQHSRMNNKKKLLFCRGISYIFEGLSRRRLTHTQFVATEEEKVSRRGARRTQVQSTKCRHFFPLFTFLSCEVLFCVWYSIRAQAAAARRREEERRGKKGLLNPHWNIYFVWALSIVMCVMIVERNTHEMKKKSAAIQASLSILFSVLLAHLLNSSASSTIAPITNFSSTIKTRLLSGN